MAAFLNVFSAEGTHSDGTDARCNDRLKNTGSDDVDKLAAVAFRKSLGFNCIF